MLLGQNTLWKTGKIGQYCRKRQPRYIHRKIHNVQLASLVCQRFAGVCGGVNVLYRKFS